MRADDALVAWAAKQHTYAADLLAPPAAAAVQALLLGRRQGAQAGPGGVPALSLAERKEVVQVLRQLAAVAQPNRCVAFSQRSFLRPGPQESPCSCRSSASTPSRRRLTPLPAHHPLHRNKSQSHVAHCTQESVEQAATTALLKEQTRIRTMGFPRKVAVKGFNRRNHRDGGQGAGTGGSTTTSNSSSTAAPGSLSSAGHPKKPAVRALDMVDTQMSRVPLKWAGSSVVPPSSSYTATFGAHPGRSPQVGCACVRV
jgi:hypothetical protein